MVEKVPYALTEVTVYPDRAKVSCRGSVQLTSSVDALLFDELPLSIEKESVRVSGSGDVAVKILSVDVTREHYEYSPSPRIKELDDELDAVNEAHYALEDELATWQAEADLLEGLRMASGEYAKGLARGRISIADQNDLLTYIRTQDSAIRKEQRALQSQIRALTRKREKLEMDLSELRSAQPRHRYQVRVAVAVDGEGQFFPELSYVVRGAQWHPLYDLHYDDLKGSDSRLTIAAYAQVSQRTGQDWQDVRLKVSTARPALNQRLPELKPWYIDSTMPPVPVPVQSAKRTAMLDNRASAEDTLMSRPAMAAPEKLIDADFADAAVHTANAIVTYRVEGSCTVATDGSPSKFYLARISPTVDMSYLSIPKHTDAVFRLLKVLNVGAAPLLPGQASLFFNDEYIGRTQLDYTPAAGELELLLGIEERIEVTRELTSRKVDKKLLKDDRIVSFAYEVKLKNLLQKAADVELREQMPLSRHEEIKVKLDEVKPQPSKQTDMNILEWHLILESQSEQVVRYAYEVQSPRSMRVSGIQD